MVGLAILPQMAISIGLKVNYGRFMVLQDITMMKHTSDWCTPMAMNKLIRPGMACRLSLYMILCCDVLIRLERKNRVSPMTMKSTTIVNHITSFISIRQCFLLPVGVAYSITHVASVILNNTRLTSYRQAMASIWRIRRTWSGSYGSIIIFMDSSLRCNSDLQSRDISSSVVVGIHSSEITTTWSPG